MAEIKERIYEIEYTVADRNVEKVHLELSLRGQIAPDSVRGAEVSLHSEDLFLIDFVLFKKSFLDSTMDILFPNLMDVLKNKIAS